MRGSTRAADLAGAGAQVEPVLARVGANAFTLLLLVDVGGEREAERVARRLMRAVALPMPLGGGESVLTASIGVAMFPRDAREIGGLERCAEQAVDAAKAGGREQLRFFDEAINRRASARLAQEGELRRAIGAGELRLHYQPKFDAARGAVVGAEALVRWQHPQRGLVLPGEFVPLAEETGLIGALTDWVLDAAGADQARRLERGGPVVPVAVNLSGAIFDDEDLVERLGRLLEHHALAPRWLVLEVTESVLMRDVERAVARLHALRERGFAISLDDFGTGYSSLGHLKRFPLDELKIDRSFVTDATRGGRDGAIAASIIALGREFGLAVVAEGVETAAQSQFLLGQGCPLQQGFLFARPMPAAAFDELLYAAQAAQAATV